MRRELVIIIWTVAIILLTAHIFSYRTHIAKILSSDKVDIVETVYEDSERGSTSKYLLLGRVRLVLKGQNDLSYGDIARVGGELTCSQRSKDESYNCTRADIKPALAQKIGFDEKVHLTVFMDRFRLYLRSIIAKSFSTRQSQLLSGILLGSQDLPSSFKSQLANVGLSHIVAASGMNVTLVAGLVFGLFSSVPGNKRLKVLIGTTLIFFYGGITGFDPPIARACLMASCLFLAPLFGRQSSSVITLLVAAYLMLWADPSLLEDFGFLLSFSSMIGQIGLISLDLKVTNAPKLITELIGQTLAAILVTLPIVLIGFSQFSLISIVTNVLVIWTIEPLMFLGGIILLLGLVSERLAYLASLPAYPILDYFLWVVDFFDRPEFVWKVKMNWITGIGYYLLLAVSFIFLRSRLRNDKVETKI